MSDLDVTLCKTISLTTPSIKIRNRPPADILSYCIRSSAFAKLQLAESSDRATPQSGISMDGLKTVSSPAMNHGNALT